MKIFGTDGVRGKAGLDISPVMALKVGLAAGIFFKKSSNTNKILIGKDTRRSGYMIENALVSAFTSMGFDVIQIGPMPTPAISFLSEDMRCDAGIMISASHNPYDDNGIKFFNKDGYKLDERSEKEIEEIFSDEGLLNSFYKVGSEIGSAKRIDDVVGRYIVHIKNSFPKNLNLKDIRIVVDTANGAGYKVAPTIFNELGADVVVINNNPNGFNINADCGAMHPSALTKQVRLSRADIGFALDGDADRLVVVDNEGEIIHGDKVLGALALYKKLDGSLKNNGIVATKMSNLALEKFLAQHQINLFRSDVGDKFVLEEMLKGGFNLGGEQSGHIIFSDFVKTGDGIISALQILALMVKSKKSAAKALNLFNLHPQLQENIVVSHKPPLERIIKELMKNKLIPENTRYLIRYSGTEPLLRILLEGEGSHELTKTMVELKGFLAKQLQ